MADRQISLLDFEDLSGWAEDDHAAALDVFLSTCGDMRGADWSALCALGDAARSDPRAFFEHAFRPVLIEDGADMLFTGYYEPEIRGDRFPSAYYSIPVYRLPDPPEAGWPTRQEIDEGAFDGQGLEIAWVHDPLDLFFLQIQGSGRISLPGGDAIRLGFAGANGHPYASLGQELVARGEYEPHQVSADVIRSWVRRNGEDGRALLWHNPSYVFFREVNEVPPERGPLGAMNRSVTPLRSIAVDPSVYQLGAPVWIEKAGADPMARLMIAQDTGSAITGAQRADIFYGTGAAAGALAGRIRDGGRMVALLPIQRAYAMLPDPVPGPGSGDG
ncbi:murein transglycosylase A [Wenxinia saemankumensis]|uniref:peptidoglycan lytic exotransglycosylase n=1 Tax=Wenxinia saemankumensis TaxID=1447782 RepID=A0A1M6G2D8_9RHOB|nr:murein transglycosylase A [Wenxinia saemankumensis]SHJ04158.1 membrane-bound lytic murein transglycosylase A [Wenxinia saemankumensis]